MENNVDWMEWLPAITTLVAVVGGPLLSLWVANKQIAASSATAEKQITASLISANRKENDVK